MQIPAPDAHQCVIGVAIALPSHYAAQVRAVREAAGDPLAEVVPPHITLLPPTAVDVDALDEIMQHLRDVAAGTTPFKVRLDEVGTFRPVSPGGSLRLGAAAGGPEVKSSPKVTVALDMFGQTLYIQGNFLGSQCVATSPLAPVSMIVTSLWAYQPSA